MDFIRTNMRLPQFCIFYAEIITIGCIINNTVEIDKVDSDPANKLWYIVKDYKDNAHKDLGYRLRAGDTIKLGRVRFKITELHRGQYQTKFEDQMNCKPDPINDLNKVKGKLTRNSVVPQMNNYIKQSNIIKNLQTGEVGKRSKTQTQAMKTEKFLNSKNSFDNTDADNVGGLK